MTAIGLISDVHATASPIEEALSIFQQAGVEQIFCAGDVAGYGDQLERSVALLVDSGCQTILGNHDLLYLEQHADNVDDMAAAYFRQLRRSMNVSLGGKKIHMVHASPPDDCHNGIKLLDQGGEVETDRIAFWEKELKSLDCDVLVVGHTHQVFAQRVGEIFLLNPGSTVFNHSCAILYLPEMSVRVVPLSDREVEKTWNYSDYLMGKA